MRTFPFVLALLAVPTVAAAGSTKVAAVRGSFVVVENGATLEEQADLVLKDVSEGVSIDASLALSGAAEVDGAAHLASGGPPVCKDVACLDKVAKAVGADIAVSASVTRLESGSYSVELVLSDGTKAHEEVDKGLAVVHEVVRRLAGSAVTEALARHTRGAAADRKTPAVTRASENGAAGPGPAPTTEKKGKLNSAVPFAVSTAITIGLGAAFGVTDAIVYKRYQKLDRGEEDIAYWTKTKSLKVTECALLGATGVAVAATAVLFFMTDFDHEFKEKPALTVAPSILGNGGILTIDGRF